MATFAEAQAHTGVRRTFLLLLLLLSCCSVSGSELNLLWKEQFPRQRRAIFSARIRPQKAHCQRCCCTGKGRQRETAANCAANPACLPACLSSMASILCHPCRQILCPNLVSHPPAPGELKDGMEMMGMIPSTPARFSPPSTHLHSLFIHTHHQTVCCNRSTAAV